MSKIKIENLSKTYKDGVNAVKDINIDVKENEFLVLVGPSGCGKSTTLRMIAGLETITTGTISIDDKIINDVLPKNRDIAMVFQNYALYPHMNVYDNIAFSLKLKKIAKTKIKQEVDRVAKSLEITDILHKKPENLSGGQRQRVALGRALIRNPKVFLMDEPLSNLDAKLRLCMRTEIIKLHKSLNTTFIYVTHDQTEAMTMGERIAVMNGGQIMQIDTPQNIYEKPSNLFVARFIGTPQINVVPAYHQNDKIKLLLQTETIYINKNELPNSDKLNDKKLVTIGFRPEDVILTDDKADFTALVDVIENLGSEKYVFLKNGIILKLPSSINLTENSIAKVKIKRDKLHFFDETENRI